MGRFLLGAANHEYPLSAFVAQLTCRSRLLHAVPPHRTSGALLADPVFSSIAYQVAPRSRHPRTCAGRSSSVRTATSAMRRSSAASATPCRLVPFPRRSRQAIRRPPPVKARTRRILVARLLRPPARERTIAPHSGTRPRYPGSGAAQLGSRTLEMEWMPPRVEASFVVKVFTGDISSPLRT